VLVEEEGSTYMADSDADSDEARVLRPLQAAACTYRIAFGPRLARARAWGQALLKAAWALAGLWLAPGVLAPAGDSKAE